jgi:hypothetical protein
MMQMYTNLRQAGVSGFAIAYYWSSTERASNEVWFQAFDNSFQGLTNKNTSFRVRAFRAF